MITKNNISKSELYFNMSGHCVLKQLTPVPFLFSVQLSIDRSNVYNIQDQSDKAPDDQSEWI